MSEIDRVFSRLGGGHPAATEQHELRSIPRRGGLAGNRVVMVVRRRTPVAAGREGGTHQPARNVHAQTWEEGFPVRSAPLLPAAPQPDTATPAEPVAHVMPAWRPADVVHPEPDPPPPPVPPPEPIQARGQSSRGAKAAMARRFADPFDAGDDRANCLRCGYLVEPARERRGHLTCSGCG